MARQIRAPAKATRPVPPRALSAPPVSQRAATAAMPRHDIAAVPLAPTVQRRAAPGGPVDAVARGSGQAGLPGGLRAGIEARSGLSMAAVRVHYRSPRPAQIGAHAFAEGTDIHLAPGQERHLPHEAWHVVQQAQGRVRPTGRVGTTAINADPALEREADRMGQASLTPVTAARASPGPVAAPEAGVAQGVFTIDKGDMKGTYATAGGKATTALIDEIRNVMDDELGVGWVGAVREWADRYTGPYRWDDTDDFLEFLYDEYAKEEKQGKTRPGFSAVAYRLAKITYGLQTGVDQSLLKPSEEDLAMPHRFPYAGIELGVSLFIAGQENAADLIRWTDRLHAATEERRDLNAPEIKQKGERASYLKAVNEQLDELVAARKALIQAKKKGESLTLHSPVVQRLLKAANNMHGNIPDFGPHTKVNIPVSNRLHLHVDIPEDWDPSGDEKVPMTPGSHHALAMSPHRVGKGVAYDSSGSYVVTTDGRGIAPDMIDEYGTMFKKKKHKAGHTKIDSGDLMDS